jgi:hypothetical protein
MKIGNFGIDRPRVDQLFDLICQELDRRMGPEVGFSVLPNQLPFIDPVFASRVLNNASLGLSAFVSYGLEGELNLMMVEQELPKGGDFNLKLYRYGQPELELVHCCKNVTAAQAPLAARRVYEFFYSKFYSQHSHYASFNSVKLPSVREAIKQAFPDLEDIRALEMHQLDLGRH